MYVLFTVYVLLLCDYCHVVLYMFFRHLVPERGEDRRNGGLADLVAYQRLRKVRDLADARALPDDILVSLQLLHADDLEELGAREGDEGADAGEGGLAYVCMYMYIYIYLFIYIFTHIHV